MFYTGELPLSWERAAFESATEIKAKRPRMEYIKVGFHLKAVLTSLNMAFGANISFTFQARPNPF